MGDAFVWPESSKHPGEGIQWGIPWRNPDRVKLREAEGRAVPIHMLTSSGPVPTMHTHTCTHTQRHIYTQICTRIHIYTDMLTPDVHTGTHTDRHKQA